MKKDVKNLSEAKSADAVLPGYREFLTQLKQQIRSAQSKAALSVNRELIKLYWEIGKSIVERQIQAEWGTAVIERLSQDLRLEFPENTGFSARNLWNMRKFYQIYREHPILHQLVAEIPWGHNIVIMSKLNNPKEQAWYFRQTIEHGWSRAVLVHQIETKLYHRQVRVKLPNELAGELPDPEELRRLIEEE